MNNKNSKLFALRRVIAASIALTIIFSLFLPNAFGCIYVYEPLNPSLEASPTPRKASPEPTAALSPTPAYDTRNPIRSLYSSFSSVCSPLIDKLGKLCEQSEDRTQLDAVFTVYEHISSVTRPNASLGALYYLDGSYIGTVSGSDAGSGKIEVCENGFSFSYSYEDGGELSGTLCDSTLEVNCSYADEAKSFAVVLSSQNDSAWTSVVKRAEEISVMHIDGNDLTFYYDPAFTLDADIRDFEALTSAISVYLRFVQGHLTIER